MMFLYGKKQRDVRSDSGLDGRSDSTVELSYLDEISELFKVLGDKTRIHILRLLDNEIMKVGDLAVKLDMTNSAISHQLAILREHHIVKATRRGREVYYALDDEHISLLYELGLKHIKHKIQGQIT